MTELLKGKAVAEEIREQIRQQTKRLSVTPALATIRVGEKADDIAYEQSVCRQAEKLGITVKGFVYPLSISEEELLQEIEKRNDDSTVHGVLIFRPLPEHIDENRVAAALSPSKDIDGITPGSMAGVFMQNALGFPPCTARACMEILNHYKIGLSGKKVTVLGRSLVVGKPVAMMAAAAHGTVTICHSKTAREDFVNACRGADVLIVAMGKPQYITKEYVSEGQTVIDVGIHAGEDGSLCGDVAFDSVSETVEKITPVPGGVGTVTTAVLMLQVVEAAANM